MKMNFKTTNAHITEEILLAYKKYISENTEEEEERSYFNFPCQLFTYSPRYFGS